MENERLSLEEIRITRFDHLIRYLNKLPNSKEKYGKIIPKLCVKNPSWFLKYWMQYGAYPEAMPVRAEEVLSTLLENGTVDISSFPMDCPRAWTEPLIIDLLKAQKMLKTVVMRINCVQHFTIG